jgi:hypothetical protein
MEIEKKAADILKRYPSLERLSGWLGVLTLVLGSLSGILGKITELKRHLFDLVGPAHLLTIHFGMSILVVVFFIIGYMGLGFWVYQRFLCKLSLTHRRRYLTAMATGGLLLAGGSIFAALPPAPDMKEMLEAESGAWSKELLELHSEEGGIRYNRLDPSVEAQAWATAQVIWAVLSTRSMPISNSEAKILRAHLDYLEQVRLTGNEGWGYVATIDWGVTEIAAWVTLANLSSLRKAASEPIWGKDIAVAVSRIERDLDLLTQRQIASGGWAPIKQNDNPAYSRTYSSLMALWAIIEAKNSPIIAERIGKKYDNSIRDGIRWLLGSYNRERQTWVPNPERKQQTDSFPGLTAQALYVLERARSEFGTQLRADDTLEEARRSFVKLFEKGLPPNLTALVSRPAQQNDRTHDSDRYLPRSKFMVEGSTFLWFPWALALCSETDSGRTWKIDDIPEIRGCNQLLERVNDLTHFAHEDPFTYVMAESLFAINLQLKNK